MNLESWILLFGMGAILWVAGLLTVSILDWMDERRMARHKKRMDRVFAKAIADLKVSAETRRKT